MKTCNVFLRHWKEPLRETLQSFLEAYQSCLDTGQLECAVESAHNYCALSYFAGQELTGLERQMVRYTDFIRRSKQARFLHLNQLFRQVVLNLMGQGENPCVLQGKSYDEETMLPQHLAAHEMTTVFEFHLNKMILCYLFGEETHAAEHAALAAEFLTNASGLFDVPVFYFYDSLIRLALCSDSRTREQTRHLKRVAANQKKMKAWAVHAPMNLQHKVDVVEAERARVLGQDARAIAYYTQAIQAAQTNAYLQEEALANELAAKFWIKKGDHTIARAYMFEAHYGYQRWGAWAKVQDLATRYPHLVSGITVNRATQPIAGETTTHQTLDFAAVMKASQSLAGEIVLEHLLKTLMEIVIENAWAESGVLLLEENEKLVIEAEFAGENRDIVVLQGIPVESIESDPQIRLSIAIVNYVARTREYVVLTDATQEQVFRHDAYIQQRQPKAVLCLPLLNRGNLIGILYLENNLVSGAFTPVILEMLELLSAQMVISIEHARIHDHLEELVKKRTADVEAEIQRRKQAEEQEDHLLEQMEYQRTILVRRHQEAETLRIAIQALSSTLDLQTVFELILSELRKVVPYDSASVQQLIENQLQIIGGHGFPNLEEFLGERFDLTANDNPNREVIHRQTPLILDDAPAHYEAFHRKPHAQAHIRSWLGVPLLFGDRVIGMISLDKREPDFYTQEHAQLAQAFAAQAAVAIENARLYEQAQQEIAERKRAQDLLRIQRDLAIKLSSVFWLHEGLEYCLDAALQVSGMDCGGVYLVNKISGALELVVHKGLPPEFIKSASHFEADSMNARLVKRGEPVYTQHQGLGTPLDETRRAEHLHAIAVLPVKHEHHVIASLNIASHTQNEIPVFARVALEAITIQIGNAIVHLEAKEALQKAHDELEIRVEERTAELSKANVELERASRLKDEFLANISHELRTPLTVILGMSETLSESMFGDLNTKQRAMLQMVEESGRHLLALINDILDLAKIGAGKFDLILDAVDVEAVCQASLRLIKPMAQKKHLSIAFAYDASVTIIQADERRLRQVFVNLLNNAVKFTPEHGQIGLDVNGYAEEQCVHVTVWDTGIGILPEDLAHLFKPFEQVDGSLSRQYGGAGLGLALVERIVSMHRGKVFVESEPGKGSRFTVCLPCEPFPGLSEMPLPLASESRAPREPEQPDHERRSDASQETLRYSILLVEDNEATINTFSEYLAAKGYRIIVARNGKEAFSQTNAVHPDIILMDIQLPDVDGLAAIRQIRSQPASKDIPIIALTALAMPGDQEKCLSAGANEYLSKPVGLKALSHTIQKLLNPENSRP